VNEGREEIERSAFRAIGRADEVARPIAILSFVVRVLPVMTWEQVSKIVFQIFPD
jgi:hypothetical protein